MSIDTIDFKTELMIKTNWLNLHGLNEMEIIEAIGDLKIDNFLLSDILNTTEEQSWKSFQVLYFT
jgi:magnesium transporter